MVYRLILIKAQQGMRTGLLLPAPFPSPGLHAGLHPAQVAGLWEFSWVSTALQLWLMCKLINAQQNNKEATRHCVGEVYSR